MNRAMDLELTRIVRNAARRLTLRRALETASRAAVWTMAALAVVSASRVILAIPDIPIWTAAAAAAAAAVAAAGFIFLIRRTSLVSAARTIDSTEHLEERTSTAIELGLAPHSLSALGNRVMTDATSHVQAMDMRQTVSLPLPRSAWWIPALIAVLIAEPALVRGLALPGTPAHRVQQAIRREGARLEQFAKTLQSQARTERLPLTRRMTPQLRDLGVRLQHDRIDPSTALARISEMVRQIEAARDTVDQRLDDLGRVSSNAAQSSETMRRQTVDRQIQQLQELTAQLHQGRGAVSQDVLDRLAALTQESDATQPAPVRQLLRQAQKQLSEGNAGAAGESLAQALRTLEGMQSLLADREGLESARQRLEQSRTAIARGAPGPNAEGQGESAQEQTPPAGSGPSQVISQPGAETPPPSQGPREGSTPGAGRIAEKLGPASPRLEAERTPQRIRGAQSEGESSISEVLGAGRRASVRTPSQAVSPILVARVDRALERAHIPAQYRSMILRYFQQLAQLK